MQFWQNHAPAANGPTRRNFLRMAGASAGLAVLPTAQILAQALDPRVNEVIAAAVSVDFHSHAGGLLLNTRTATKFNVADRMKRGNFGVVTMAVVADRAAVGTVNGRTPPPSAIRKPVNSTPTPEANSRPC